MFLTHSPELRGQPSAHLTQTMRLLELNTVDLADEITRALETNPALQLVDEIRCAECGRRVRALPCPACMQKRSAGADDSPIVFLSPRLPSASRESDDDQGDSPLDAIPQTESLAEHLLRQVACATNRLEQQVAANILSRLDECGSFTEHPAEIALTLNVPLELVERVLCLIQRADPVGTATRDVRQSLLIQVDVLSESGSLHPLAAPILTSYWEPLVRRNYAAIARGLRAPLADVKNALRFIHRNLTPYPGRAWQDNGRGVTGSANDVYYQPDMIITGNPRPGGPLLVEVFTGLAGTLRVDPDIRASLKQAATDEPGIANWQKSVDEGSLLVKCVQQRNHTMRRIAEIIATRQGEFILRGDAHLKPMTRSLLAEELDLHESTVSRAVANKAVALPNGRIVPLSMFFDRSLAVRDAVLNIIKQEPQSAPLSDTQVAILLKPKGYHIARRTVAKYRQMLGILPANLRSPNFLDNRLA